MTIREKEVYELIDQNPMISQEEISEKLNIARSSVGVHISNLMKKGYILGKGYVLKESPYILVIGGANIDIEGYPLKALKLKDSNPGVVKRSFGGVGRNIAENLSMGGVETKLITLVGNDSGGREMLEYCKEKGIDTRGCELLEGESTSTYLSVLGIEKDMEIGISHMDIMEKMDEEFIQKRNSLIMGAKICILDTNLPKKTMEYLMNNFDVPFAVDTVSLEKSLKIKGLYNKIEILKPNLMEAEHITGIEVKTPEDVEKAGKKFLELGVKNVFISLGKDGVYYINDEDSGFLKSPEIEVVSSTGAGDAFLAGVVTGNMQDMPIRELAMLGIAGSICSLRSERNIPEDLSNEIIEKVFEEVKKCNFTKSI